MIAPPEPSTGVRSTQNHRWLSRRSRRQRGIGERHLQQRIRSAEVQVFKIDDPNMPADFLTKWLPAGKLRDSLLYATNSGRRVARPS